jgi:hypothetical protein
MVPIVITPLDEPPLDPPLEELPPLLLPTPLEEPTPLLLPTPLEEPTPLLLPPTPLEELPLLLRPPLLEPFPLLPLLPNTPLDPLLPTPLEDPTPPLLPELPWSSTKSATGSSGERAPHPGIHPAHNAIPNAASPGRKYDPLTILLHTRSALAFASHLPLKARLRWRARCTRRPLGAAHRPCLKR